MREIRVVNLATRREWLPCVAQWCHEAFASPSTPLQSVRSAIEEHIGAWEAGNIWPFTLVATLDGEPVGCVHGVESELDEYPDLQPFIAALFVQQSCRRLGVGGALLLAAEQECQRAGFSRAYLCAWSGEHWYTNRGWAVQEQRVGEKQVPLMTKALARSG